MKELKKIIFLLMYLAAPAIYAEQGNDNGFIFRGQPINPACVSMFNHSLADYPYITAINLDKCQHSNAAYQNTQMNQQGWIWFYFNNKNGGGGYYRYRVIGKSASSIYVLSTENNGGGTGIFSDLLLLRLTQKKIAVFTRNAEPQLQTYTQMDLLGYINGGDRCIGSFADVTLQSDLLTVTQYNGDFPNDCRKTQKFIIDLSKIPN